MKCKRCCKEIDEGLVVSIRTQIAFIEENEIVDYGTADDIKEKMIIVCRKCGYNLSEVVQG